jgi:hypothetical protein
MKINIEENTIKNLKIKRPDTSPHMGFFKFRNEKNKY